MSYGDNRIELASDAFVSSIDGNWENGGGDWNPFTWRSNGRVNSTGSGNSAVRRNNETYADDQYSIVTAEAAINASQWHSAQCRMAAGADESAYLGYTEFEATGEFQLYRTDSILAFTLIASTTTGWGNLSQGDTYTLEVEGTTLRLGDDRGTDTERLTETDANIDSGDPGFGGFATATNNIDVAAWSGGDISAATAEQLSMGGVIITP